MTEETDCMCQADGLMGELGLPNPTCQGGEVPFRTTESAKSRATTQPGHGSGECPAQLWGQWGGGMGGTGRASTHCHGSR